MGERVFAIALAFVCACGVDGADDDVGGDAGYGNGAYPDAGPPPWPTERTPLPACEAPYPHGFVEPTVAAPVGLLAMDIRSPWQPVGVDRRVAVEIRTPGTGELDVGATGELVFDVGPGAVVVSQTPISGGRASAVLRFDAPGLHAIDLTITSGGRTGTAEVWAYDSQLPIWSMEVDDAELAQIIENAGDRAKIEMTLTIDGEPYTGTVRLHGGSSLFYRKNSFRLDLDDGQELPNGSDHIVLRGEWADKTMLRNFLGLEIFRNATWLPTPEAEILHFRINGDYYGAMWHTDRIDADFLKRNRLNKDGSLYEADPDKREYWVPGGNLTVLADLTAYRETYQHHRGADDYGDLIELIEVVLTLDDDTFAEVIPNVVKVDDYLVYAAAMAVIQNQDHIRKNYYLYRNRLGADDRWVVLPWDLDLTLGHLWTEENDILDEQIFTDASLYVGKRVPEHDYYNQLMDRLLRIPEYDARFREYVDHIAAQVYDSDFIYERIDNVLCRATPELLADRDKRASNAEYLDRVDEIYDFIDARLDYIQSAP